MPRRKERTMNNTEFVAAARAIRDAGYGYIWGAKGEVATEALLQRCISAARKAGTYTFTAPKINYARTLIAAKLHVTDCSGLLTLAAEISPIGSAQIWAACSNKGTNLATIPNTPGLVVYRLGHIGIYVGDGVVCESGGYSKGVLYSPLYAPATGKPWTGWGYWNQIDYTSAPVTASVPTPVTWSASRILKLTSPIQTGEDVKGLQTALATAGYPCGTADGKLGKRTDAAIRAYQSAKGLTVDGKAGRATITALGGTWTGK